MGDRISLCIIARNEEANLPRCLTSAADVVDEIVLVDTGSTDRTVDIAESFGARVFHRPWQGSFSLARNSALEQATGDWVLVLDADDELPPDTRAALRELVTDATPAVTGYGFTIASWIGRRPGGHVATVLHPRLWRNQSRFRYAGAIHEWVDLGPIVYSGLRIYHHGYLTDRATERAKSARNLPMLLQAAERDPDSGFFQAQLGAEYLRLGRLPIAAGYYRRAWAREKSHFMADALAHTLLRLRQFGAARRVLEEALPMWPDFTDLHYRYGCALAGLGLYTEGRAAIRRCLAMGPPPPEYPSTEGYSSFMAWLQLGHVEAALHNWEASARAAWESLASMPTYTPALSLLIRSLVAFLGPEGALRLLQEQTELTASAQFQAARFFAEWGCWTEALHLLEGTDERVLRADCLLALGEVEAAAAELGDTPGPVRDLVDWIRTGHGNPPQSPQLNLVEKLLVVGRPDLGERVPVYAAGPLGRLYTRYDHREKAEPLLEEALAGWGRRRRELPCTGGNRCDLLLDLGTVRLRTGRSAAAAMAFREVLEAEPHRLPAWLALAEAYLRGALTLQPDPALSTLAEAIKRERHRAEPVYDRQGRSAPAGQGAEQRA